MNDKSKKEMKKDKDLCEKTQQCDKPPTATDIYANTKCRKEDSNVAIPTEESVEQAKEWVDDENKM